MASVRERTLHYRRAIFLVDTVHQPSLDFFVKDVHALFQTVEDRRIKPPSGGILECRRYQESSDGIAMQIVAYNPGEEMSIVPHIPKKNDLDLGTTPPPQGADFWDGDVNLLISGNHVIYCASNANEKDIERYLVGMFQKKGYDDGALLWSLRKIAPVDKVRLLKSQGIKKLKMNTTLYEASIDHEFRKTIKKKIMGGVWDVIQEYFEQDQSISELLISENVSAEVVFRFDSRKKGGDFARERLENLAQEVINSSNGDENGFAIITGDNQTIRASDLSLSKQITIDAHGKTIECSGCWREMKKYFVELRDIGALEK